MFARYGKWARDAMSQDLFDVEVDVTWAHNSAVDVVELRMNPGIRINGTPGFVPENGDIPHQWKEVIGVRLGGEVIPIPDLLAVRAGGFFESKGQDDAYLNIDFHQGWRAGIATGLTVRLSRFDISAAYQHTFFGALDNGGAGALRGLSGDATTGASTPDDPSDDFRTHQIVNGGRATSSLDEVALGATVRF
jgi:long-chain fatty acid transport protein